MIFRKRFFDFMTDNYIKEDSPAGDLARDINRDKSFPQDSMSRKEIIDYLKQNNACAECLETFKWCWKEYAFWKGEAAN